MNGNIHSLLKFFEQIQTKARRETRLIQDEILCISVLAPHYPVSMSDEPVISQDLPQKGTESAKVRP